MTLVVNDRNGVPQRIEVPLVEGRQLGQAFGDVPHWSSPELDRQLDERGLDLDARRRYAPIYFEQENKIVPMVVPVDERVPARTQQATLRALGDSRLRELVTRFADAWERNDVDAVVALLADDARMTMPPQPSWYQGRDAVAGFLRARPLSDRNRFRLLPTGAGGQPAFGAYLWDGRTSSFAAESIIVLTFGDAGIDEITAFRTPALLARFGLPERLPSVSSRR